MRYRTKRTYVDAVRFEVKKRPWPEGVNVFEVEKKTGEPKNFTLYTQSRGGFLRIFDGDWIVTHPSGLRVPCKPEAFEKMYEVDQ